MNFLSVEELEEKVLELDLIPDPQSSKKKDENDVLFYNSKLSIFTESLRWVSILVVQTKLDKKPQILMRVPLELREKLVRLNALIMNKLSSTFPDEEVRPWITDDHTWIRFAIPRQQLGDTYSGPLYIQIEEPENNCKRLLYGPESMLNNFMGQHMYARFEFDFRYIYKKGNVVGFTPRLMSLIDCTPTDELSGYETV